MGRILNVGWELNSLTEVSSTGGTTPTIVTGGGLPRTGSYALRTAGTGAASWVRHHVATSNLNTVGHLGVAFRVETLPSSQSRIIRFSNLINDPQVEVRQETSGLLTLWNAAAAQVTSIGGTSGAATITADGNYHIIEVKNDSSGSGALSLWVDNVLIADAANTAQGSWCRVLIGSIATNTQSYLWDDWKVNDGNGSFQTGRTGPGKLAYLRPDASGTDNAWLDSSGNPGTTNNYTLVDDLTPDGGTTHVRSSTVGAKDYYNLSTPPITSSDVVNVVAVGCQLADFSGQAGDQEDLRRNSGPGLSGRPEHGDVQPEPGCGAS